MITRISVHGHKKQKVIIINELYMRLIFHLTQLAHFKVISYLFNVKGNISLSFGTRNKAVRSFVFLMLFIFDQDCQGHALLVFQGFLLCLSLISVDVWLAYHSWLVHDSPSIETIHWVIPLTHTFEAREGTLLWITDGRNLRWLNCLIPVSWPIVTLISYMQSFLAVLPDERDLSP